MGVGFKGIRKRTVTAALLLAVAGGARAGLQEGIEAYQEANYPLAWAELRPLADQGDPVAQTYIGVMYDHGQGVPRDSARAATWFRKSAEQGHAAAQRDLGLLYEHGRGVRKDLEQAAAWYQRAAVQGHAAAQYRLGVMYEQGRGVPQDPAQAMAWYGKAAGQGHAAAQAALQAEAERQAAVQAETERQAAQAEAERQAALKAEAAAQAKLLGSWTCTGDYSTQGDTQKKSVKDHFHFRENGKVTVSRTAHGTYTLSGSRFTLAFPGMTAYGTLTFLSDDAFHQVTDAHSQGGRSVHRDYHCSREGK